MLSHKKNNVKRILLTGGGTGGSVSPLLAIAEELKNTPIVKGGEGGYKFLWLGTKNGPEKEMVESQEITFKAVSSGKLRRYFSSKNFTDLFLIIIGFVQSFFIILKWKPDLVISAGSFVSVPVVWAAWILRIPILVHQQDARPGLANKLMAPFAKVITAAFEKSLSDYGKKAALTGNPARHSLEIKNQKSKIKNIFNFNEELPTVLVIGGGTGAMAINELVWKSIDELTKLCQIIHITGKGKNPPYPPYQGGVVGKTPLIKGDRGIIKNKYQSFEFFNAEQMAEAYNAADIVVSRAGMGVLTELSYLGKPAILIPIPNSHQEENAEIFKQAQAAIAFEQKNLTPEILVDNIKKLLNDEILRNKLSDNIKNVIKRGASEKIAGIIKNLLK